MIVLVALVHSCAAFSASGPALHRQHTAAVATAPPPLVLRTSRLRAETAAAPEPSRSPLAWIKSKFKVDKSQLQTLGVDAFFTYGVVSNLNVALTAALAWGAFTKRTGLSPLAPGQMPLYTATYGAIYVSLGTLLRPARMALALSLTPLYTRCVARLRASLPFYDSRPKLNRTLALVIVSLLLNVVGTGVLAAIGVYIASLVTGVPVLPG